ncbi:MAG: hypothetical protein C4555_04335 [Dehalococcoidia bacterium]|nr:MAG: hypothetical protein C4555_04335 [Dehalococcoidia bacterium]
MSETSKLRIVMKVPLGGNGAEMVFETLFDRETSKPEIDAVMDKLEMVAARQVAKSQLVAIEDALQVNETRRTQDEYQLDQLIDRIEDGQGDRRKPRALTEQQLASRKQLEAGLNKLKAEYDLYVRKREHLAALLGATGDANLNGGASH